MNQSFLREKLQKNETIVHFGFWVFYFATINANWAESWFDRSLRPESVSQFAIVLFPILFYTNALGLIPSYLKKRKWFAYIFVTAMILLGVEIFRIVMYTLLSSKEGPLLEQLIAEYNSYDNVIFGRLHPAILSLQFSFAYRFSKDWVVNNRLLKKIEEEHHQPKEETSAVDINYRSCFMIKKKSQVVVLKTTAIVYFKAQGDFILAIDETGKKHIVNSTLSKVESELNPEDFFKINRSEIINKNYVINYETYIKNRLKIMVSSLEAILYTSNSRTPQFRKWLKD